MASVKVDGLTILVTGYYDNNNSPYFQVSVPLRLRVQFKRSKVSIGLVGHDTRQHVTQCQHLHQRFKTLFDAVQRGEWSGAAPLSKMAEAWLEEVTASSAAIDALTLPVTLTDAFNAYIDNHKRGREQRFKAAQWLHWQKLIDFAGNISLKSLNRDHARRYRDERLCKGIKQPSVQREISTIKAIINVARREIPIEMVNPFDGLIVTAPTEEHQSTRRLPYSIDELQRLVAAAQKIDDERRRIVVVLAFTGARLAEVVGLRRADVDLHNQTVAITPHKSRSLKTTTSARTLPLLTPALDALTTQLRSHDQAYVFPTYSNEEVTNANSASAALNKWAQTIILGKTMHSLRHSMRDLLRNAGCPEEVAKEIGGWSNSDVSAGYGLGTNNEVKRHWLRSAFTALL